MAHTTESFSAAVVRCFGSADALRRVAFSAMRRHSGAHLYLTAQGDDLRLYATREEKEPGATVLLHTQAPQTPGNDALQLRWDVVDWRSCAMKWQRHLTHRPPWPMP